MSERKIHKTLSVLVALTLLLGLLAPVAEVVGEGNTNDGETSLLDTGDGDLIIQEGDTHNITSDELRDGNIRVKEDAHLRIINSTLTLRQDRNSLYNITVENGAELTLDNGTINTWRGDEDIIRPFLKTDVTVTDESKLSLNNNSSFSFPGFVYILEGSELEMRDSEFKALDEVPSGFENYDYLWAEGERESLAEDDNNNGPRLIVMGDSEVYMENSEINDYYNLDEYDRKEMTWYPLDDDGTPIEELQENGDDYVIGGEEEEATTPEINEWFLSNPMVPHEYLDEYPYINPINIISSLFLEITYETGENYTGDRQGAQLNYSTPGDQEGYIPLEEDPDDDSKATSIWEKELREIFKDERDGETRLLLGDEDFEIEVWNPEDDEDEGIEIEELRLVSSYDNDIHVVDSDFTAIDSFLDLDVNPSDIDPREDESSPTTDETYLQNSDMDHKTIRFYGESSFRSYGLSIEDDEVDDDADPWILNNEDSHDSTWVYRWVELQVTTEEGTPLPGAEIDPIPQDLENETLWEMVNETLNDPTLSRNEDAWEYLSETGNGEFDEDEQVYRTGEEGRITMFLVTDRVNYPDDLWSSQFVGNYILNITYIDEEQEIDVSRDIPIDHLEDLMTMENPDEVNAELPVKLPDLQAEELKVEDEQILPGDKVELNMTVSNIGDGDAHDVNVSFYEDEFDWDYPQENYFNSTNITHLEAGENESVKVTWEAGAPGSHDLIGVVDPQNNITEKDTDNNIIEITTDVLEEAYFSVEIDEVASDEEVVEGEELDVIADITNEGEEEATQTIELYDADETEPILDDQDVTLDGGASETVTLTWQTGLGDPGNYDLNVSSEDDEDQINVDVLEQAEFTVEIDEIESDLEVVEGEDLNVVANITNIGEEETTQTIELYDVDEDDTILDDADITLGEDEYEYVTLTWETEVNEAGEYYIEVRSDDDEAAMEVTVLQQAFFEVTIDEDPSDLEVVEGEEMEIHVDIVNTGEQEEEVEKTIELYDVDFPNIVLDDEQVTLGPGDEELITLTWSTEVNDAGEYTLQVASEDDEDELDVSVLKVAEFAVDIDRGESDTEGVEGDDFVIVADIENIGDEIDIETQTIELLDEGGTVLDEEEVSLGPGDTERVGLIWQTEVGDAGDHVQNFQLEVASEDDSDRIIVELDPAPNLNFVPEEENWYIDGEEIEPVEGFELEEGDTLTFEGQIRNDGGAPISDALFEYRFPDGARDNEYIDVEVDETVDVSAEWNVRVIDDPEISIWVNSTADDERTHDEIRYTEEDFEDIDPTTVRFEDLDIPDQEMVPGDSYHFSGRVVRDGDGKPLENIDVTISIRSSPELVSETVSTGDDGEFGTFIQIPEDASGEYTVEFEAHTHDVQSTQESVEVETDVLEIAGIPWWLLLVIVAIAAGGAGSAFAYFKFFGVGEMVECGNCGATISAEATSCPKCGVEFDMDTVKCSECSEWIPADQDVCPECGAEFVKTGKEVEDYTQRMRKQYKKFIRQKKREAEEELDRELSQQEFMDWWKDKPSFVTFEDWLERKEKQRREGSVECPNCGTLNSVDDAVCQKCGTSLIDLEEEDSEVFLEEESEEEMDEEMTFEEELEEEKSDEEEMEESTEEEPSKEDELFEEPPSEDEESLEEESSEEDELFESEGETNENEEKQELEESTDETEEEEKKVKKKPKKKVKKKVVKKSEDEEE